VDILTSTSLSPQLVAAARERIAEQGWSQADVVSRIGQAAATLERRNQGVANKWIKALWSP